MADDPKPDPKPDPEPDPDAGAKKALEAERKLRREAEQKSKDLEARLAKLENDGKSASDKEKGEAAKLTEQLGQLQKDLDQERVMRLKAEVAADKGLTPAQAKRLSGSTKEELEEDADDLIDAFPAPTKGEEGDEGAGSTTSPSRPAPASKPKERLKAGTGTDDPPADPTQDIRKLGASMFGDG